MPDAGTMTIFRGCFGSFAWVRRSESSEVPKRAVLVCPLGRFSLVHGDLAQGDEPGEDAGDAVYRKDVIERCFGYQHVGIEE
jgi:hypothetical protein